MGFLTETGKAHEPMLISSQALEDLLLVDFMKDLFAGHTGGQAFSWERYLCSVKAVPPKSKATNRMSMGCPSFPGLGRCLFYQYSIGKPADANVAWEDFPQTAKTACIHPQRKRPCRAFSTVP